MERRECILVVDDDIITLKTVSFMLKEQYEIDCVNSGEECLAYLQESIPDMILLDMNMPKMSGLEVLERMKKDPQFAKIPVIFLSAEEDKEAEVKGVEAGALDFITKPFTEEIVVQRVNRLMELVRLRSDMDREVRRQTAKAEQRRRRMEQMTLQAVRTLANTIDAKDAYTNGHSYRVAEYAVLLARELGWDEEGLEDLRHAALLHDVGKIGVPDSVLNKPGRLTNEEYNVIKSHALKGGEILECITAIAGADQIAKHHHERYDGTGYPDGLAGEEIPEGARIVAIADAYDAMNSRRIYRNRLSKSSIREELLKGRGTQFDPKALDVFVKMLDEGRVVIQEPSMGGEDAAEMLFQKVMESMSNRNNQDSADFLTGLPLRSAGEVQIAEAMQDADGCLAFLDVDNLKKVNDTVGHRAGDRVLKLMGDVLMEYADNSIVCRLGGDEFLLFMKGVSQQEATDRIEKLIEQFMNKKDEDITTRQASLSVGMCMTTPMDVFVDAYTKADKALYHVKQNGKAGYSFFLKEEGLAQEQKNIDLLKLMETLKDSGGYEGAMTVEYRQFAKLFEYMGNLKERYAHDFHLLMITLEGGNADTLYIDELEEAMQCMEMAIKENIRNVDFYTRYSSIQFLVILLEAGNDNVHMIVDRIFASFYKSCRNVGVKPSYSVAETGQDTEAEET